MDIRTERRATNARSVARRLAVQAIYRWQINDGPWQDLLLEFADAEDMPKADREYFRELIQGVCATRAQLGHRHRAMDGSSGSAAGSGGACGAAGVGV